MGHNTIAVAIGVLYIATSVTNKHLGACLATVAIVAVVLAIYEIYKA